MPMGQMMQGQMMGQGMMQGQGMPGSMMSRGMMGRFSAEDMSAFIDAHIAAIHAGLKLSADQEKLWPPVETAIRNLATLHLGHMQAMRQTRGMAASDPVGLLRAMADRMSQGADAMRKLADAASPLYATLDEAQKRRLQVLVRMGGRDMMGQGMMGRGMMGPGRAMMPGGSGDDDDVNEDNR
ncbi:LTXXQ motif family protein (plasmid) [Bosea sp. F3-2]|nr:LTXXQ motif family protein [Bosea sp. F3-2]